MFSKFILLLDQIADSRNLRKRACSGSQFEESLAELGRSGKCARQLTNYIVSIGGRDDTIGHFCFHSSFMDPAHATVVPTFMLGPLLNPSEKCPQRDLQCVLYMVLNPGMLTR